MAPQFTSCGFNTTDINLIQLDDDGAGMVGYGDNMQIVSPYGNPEAVYCYWDAMYGSTGQNFWGDEGANPVQVSFDRGDGIAIDNSAEMEFNICNSGEVIKGEVRFPAGEALNFSGNPFSAPININNVQLDDGGAGMVGYGDNMQIVSPYGNPEAVYCYWDAMYGSTGKNFWGDEGANPVNVNFNPGDGFAIDNSAEMEFDIVITPPYSL